MNRDTGSGFFSGLVIGALVGLSLGFLYAPQSGEETRRAAKEKIQVARNKVSKKVKDWQGDIKNRMNNESE